MRKCFVCAALALLLALPLNVAAAAAAAAPQEPEPLASAELAQAPAGKAAGVADVPALDAAPTFAADTPAPEGGTPVEQFVARFYNLVLDRAPENGEDAGWVQHLNTHEDAGADIAEGVFLSPEVEAKDWTDEEFVTRLYLAILGREPDEGGLAAWVDLLQHGMTKRSTLQGFVESPEFTALCGEYGIERGNIVLQEARERNAGVTQFVWRCYDLALHRTPDAGGLNGWCAALLDEGEAGGQVAYGFIFSDEFFSSETTWGDYLRLLYRLFFDREADTEGLNGWTQAVENGAGRYEVFCGFANSDEFRALCAGYGIDAGVMPAWEPVPISQLANYPSVKKRASDAQFAEAYQVAAQISRRYAHLPREQQLRGIARELRYLFDNEMEYSMSAPNYDDPYGYFVRHVASCAGCTRATGLCLNILGIPYEHVNENGYTHQWCRVPMPDGTFWICDAYGLTCGPEPAPYQHPYF